MHNTLQNQTIDPEFQLFTEAAAGSSDAFATLAKLATGAGDRGNIRVAEAVEAAVSLRAFAACLEDEHGDFLLGSMFDAATADEIADIRLLYRSAAKGNVPAIRSLIHIALHVTGAGLADVLIGLSNAEIFGRLGASTGDLEATRLLVATLCYRAEYEEQAGQIPAAQYVRAQAVDFAMTLYASDDADMRSCGEYALRGLAPTLGDDMVVHLASEYPVVVSFLTPAGNA